MGSGHRRRCPLKMPSVPRLSPLSRSCGGGRGATARLAVPVWSLALLELALDGGRDPLVVGGDGRRGAGDDLAVAGNEELLEVPQDLGVFGRGHPVAPEVAPEALLVALGRGHRGRQ